MPAPRGLGFPVPNSPTNVIREKGEGEGDEETIGDIGEIQQIQQTIGDIEDIQEEKGEEENKGIEGEKEEEDIRIIEALHEAEEEDDGRWIKERDWCFPVMQDCIGLCSDEYNPFPVYGGPEEEEQRREARQKKRDARRNSADQFFIMRGQNPPQTTTFGQNLQGTTLSRGIPEGTTCLSTAVNC